MRLFRLIILSAIFFAVIPSVAKMSDVGAYAEGTTVVERIQEKGRSILSKVKKRWKGAKTSWSSFWGDSKKEDDASKLNKKSKVTEAKTSQANPSLNEPAEVETTASNQEKDEQARLINQMPEYSKAASKTYKQQAKDAKKQLRQQELFSVTKKGRKGAKLRKFRRYKKIPRLNVGLESEISMEDFFLPKIKVSVEEYLKANPLKKPKMANKKELLKARKIKISKRVKLKKAKINSLKLRKPVTLKRIHAARPGIKSIKGEIVEKPIRPLHTEDIRYLEVLIESQKEGACPRVMGLARELWSMEKYRNDARLFLGRCAMRLGLTSDGVEYLVPLLGENGFVRESVMALTKNLPEEYFSKVAPLLAHVKNKKSLRLATQGDIHYILAKHAYEEEQYQESIRHGKKLRIKDSNYFKARYLVAVSHFNLKQFTTAKKMLDRLRGEMKKQNRVDKNIKNLASLALARIAFEKQHYKTAFNEYQKVNKDHPSWVQAMIELGWVQVAMGDFAGAIGNMYSLHSPYFNAVYKPESWSVRAIGYLNICQYGDAYRSINHLEKVYRGWMNQVDSYLKRKKKSSAVYNTVFSYLSGGNSRANVDRLPFQVIREIGRQQRFLKVQEWINNRIDEKDLYAKHEKSISKSISRAKWRKNKATQRVRELRKNIRLASKKKALLKNLSAWKAQKRLEEKLVTGYTYQIATYKKSLKSFRKLKRKGIGRLARMESSLRQEAGRVLRSKLVGVRKHMRYLLDNNELLRFEVFSGSGENIRFQVSGGVSKGVNRIPAHIRPKKIMKWDFEGEYWEDEIGSYRSSLKNNCPNYGSQARINGGKK